MALNDILAQKMQREQELQDFLKNRNQGITNELGVTKQRIEAGRAKALGPGMAGSLDSLAAGANLSSGVVGSAKIGAQNQARKLDTNLTANLAKTQYGLQQDRSQKLYELAYNQALNSGKSRQDAEAFARQYADQQIQQGYTANSNQMAMNQQMRQTEIQNAYQAQLQGLQDQFQPQADVQGALTRILTGLPVQLLTSYYLNKSTAKPQPSGQTNFQPQQKTGLDESGYGQSFG